MTFNTTYSVSASERGAALRAQREADQRAARSRRNMSKQEKSPTGVPRVRLDTKQAKSAVGSLYQELDQALDAVGIQFQRERQAQEADAAQRSSDARRASALENPRGGR